MALVEWRKDGKEVVLPGDDPNISVQVNNVNNVHVCAYNLGYKLCMHICMYLCMYSNFLCPTQSRGGPQKYELSSWLQIEDATREDSGTYRCIAKNSLGNVSATVVLGILPPGNNLPVSDFQSEFALKKKMSIL